MPIITFVSPKGGTGKSTSALLLATFLSKAYDVTIIDADPNRPIQDWADGGHAPTRLSVISDVEESNIRERIDDAATKSAIVIVDLEGTRSKIVLYAIELSDFVIIPMQASFEDAKAASRAVSVIRQSERMTGDRKPFAVLLTRTSPMIRPRGLAHIQKGLLEAGVPILKTEMHERDAFKAVFSFQRPLDDLDPKIVSNLDKAKRNVGDFAEELVERIWAEQGGNRETGDEVTAMAVGGAG